MNSRSILIYGAGNCEIAGALEFELNQITQINKPNIKLFARGCLFNNSCSAMYRRFGGLKEKIKEVNQGGMQEYFYDGSETVKTCELKMSPISEETFKEFLCEGVRKLQGEEVILVLIGQGNLEGMLFDFYQRPSAFIPYERLFAAINECLKGKVKRLGLVIDVPQWHNIYMPLCVSRYSLTDAIYIYERTAHLEVFPICQWINEVFDTNCHWVEATHKLFNGYKIDLHPIWWALCSNKWKEYIHFPSDKSFEEFYRFYKKVVLYKGISQRIYSQMLSKQDNPNSHYLTIKHIKDYFNTEYLIDVAEDEIEKWLNELKICIDYYK